MAGVIAVAEQKAYQKGKEDMNGVVAFAEQKAYLKGKEEMADEIAFAEDKAFEKGVQQERVKVEAEKLEEKRETARSLKHKEISLDIISDSTGLSIQEIAL